MTKVKICGITNLEDARLAVRFGADMLGFNFYRKSPRYIEPDKAAEIVVALPSNILNVGVFVNENSESVVDIAARANLHAVQLHGDESPDYVQKLRDIDVIKAFRISDGFDEKQLDEFNVDSILIDAFSVNEYGGAGVTCDWHISKRIADRFPKMFLSGGLSADNVQQAIKSVRPYAVDACSLLESSKGKKDAARLEAFLKAAKSTL